VAARESCPRTIHHPRDPGQGHTPWGQLTHLMQQTSPKMRHGRFSRSSPYCEDWLDDAATGGHVVFSPRPHQSTEWNEEDRSLWDTFVRKGAIASSGRSLEGRTLSIPLGVLVLFLVTGASAPRSLEGRTLSIPPGFGAGQFEIHSAAVTRSTPRRVDRVGVRGAFGDLRACGDDPNACDERSPTLL
jgi:hypothetical protein